MTPSAIPTPQDFSKKTVPAHLPVRFTHPPNGYLAPGMSYEEEQQRHESADDKTCVATGRTATKLLCIKYEEQGPF